MQTQKIAGISTCLLILSMLQFPLSAVGQDVRTSPGSSANTFTMEKNLRKHVDMRAMFSYSPSKVDIYGKEHKLPIYGLRLEIIRGFEIPIIPNFKVGIGVSYLQIGREHSFSADIDPTTSGVLLKTCEMNAMITGTMVLARYGYNFNIGGLPVALENGIGTGYFYQRNDWKFKNSDGTDYDGGLERVESAKSVFDFGIKVEILRREHPNLSLNINRLLMPVLINIDKGATAYGIYKTEYVDELGVIWRVLF